MPEEEEDSHTISVKSTVADDVKLEEHDLMKLRHKIEQLQVRWSDEKEVLYLKDKKQAMHNFHKLAKNPTYTDCALARYTEAVLNDADVKLLRTSLLEKVADGQQLTEQEARYVELTSETLNMFLDKDAYQKAVQMLDPHFLDYLEAAVAESVLSNYFALRDKLKHARKQHLLRKIVRQRKEVAQTADKPSPREEGRKAQQRNLQKILKKQVLRVLDHSAGEAAGAGASASVQPQRKRPQTEAPQPQRARSALHPELSAKEYAHRNHPPSRVLNDPLKSTHPRFQHAPEVERRQQQERSFRLFASDVGRLKDQRMFTQHYSAGPLSRLQRVLHVDKLLLTRVAVTIQRFYRGYRTRRIFAKYGPAYNFLLQRKQSKSQSPARRSSLLLAPRGPHDSSHLVGSKRVIPAVSPAKPPPVVRARSAIARSKTINEKALSHELERGRSENHGNDASTAYRIVQESKLLLACCLKNQLEKLAALGFSVRRAHTRFHDEHDNTALFYAAKHQNTRLARFLLERGADPNAVCTHGNTPFHAACVGNNKPFIGLFASFAAAHDVVNFDGHTPTDMKRFTKLDAAAPRGLLRNRNRSRDVSYISLYPLLVDVVICLYCLLLY